MITSVFRRLCNSRRILLRTNTIVDAAAISAILFLVLTFVPCSVASEEEQQGTCVATEEKQQATPDKEPPDEDSVEIRMNKERYGFDIRFANIIRYRWLPEDRMDPNYVPIREVIVLIQNGKYDEAVAKAESELEQFVQKFSPWKIKNVKDGNRTFFFLASDGYGKLLNHFSQLLGLAYEMQGDYKAAWESYGVAYGSNPRALQWTRARLYYESGLNTNAFELICKVFSDEYSFTPENVESVINKVKTVEDGIRKNIYPSDMDAGIPTGRNDDYFRDSEVLEMYRIRNWCVRFIHLILITHIENMTIRRPMESVMI